MHAVRCCRVSGLSMRQMTRRGPVWRCADWVQIAYASLKALRSDAGFPDPVSLIFALTCPPTYSHPRRLPALRRSLRRWREPGSSPSSSVAPRRCAPSCWPAPPRRGILGLRASIPASQGSVVTLRRTAQRTTVIAPVISNGLKSRWPIFDSTPQDSKTSIRNPGWRGQAWLRRCGGPARVRRGSRRSVPV